MKKIYLVLGICSIILLSLVVIIGLLGKSKINNKSLLVPTPTLIKITSKNNPNQITNNIQNISPLETTDFSLSYSPSLNKVIVQKKTADAKLSYYDWAYQNNYPQLVEDESLTNFTESTGKGISEEKSGSEILIDFLNIFLNFGQGQSNQPTPADSLTPYPNLTLLPTYSGNSSDKVYYSQCNGYGGVALPDGCTLCQAGCGPTTIAMIASSYLNSSYNPERVANLYESNGSYLGCNGSGYLDAQSLMDGLGLNTTLLIYGYEKADTVAPDLKNYIDAGWTFFVLANFRESGGGHFFWVTDVDNQGNIWAYDPYYGRYSSPPFNENSRYPFPLYRVAIGVRK